jgi:hypothetical protein
MGKKETVIQLQHAFSDWWQRWGKWIDPDTEDVDWFDKRAGLCEFAFQAGYALGKGRHRDMAVSNTTKHIQMLRLRQIIADLRGRTWLAPLTADEMNYRDRYLADALTQCLPKRTRKPACTLDNTCKRHPQTKKERKKALLPARDEGTYHYRVKKRTLYYSSLDSGRIQAVLLAKDHGHLLRPWESSIGKDGRSKRITSCQRCDAMAMVEYDVSGRVDITGGATRRTCDAILRSKSRRKKR